MLSKEKLGVDNWVGLKGLMYILSVFFLYLLTKGTAFKALLQLQLFLLG